MLTGKAKIAGIIGWPVGHSLSPRLHGYWLRLHGIDGAYIPMPVRPEDLGEALTALPKLGMVGINVTVPHKENVLSFLDSVDEAARRIGAVNTIAFDAEGRAHGWNTDTFGFLESLRDVRPLPLSSADHVVVLGAGGAARAVVAALASSADFPITLINRTSDRARVLAGKVAPATKVVEWQDRNAALAQATLLVNTTTLGMTGQPPLDIDLGPLPTSATVMDIVYVPLMTPLLKAAAARGNPIIDGLGMLLHQARPGFKAWFGVEPIVTSELRSILLEALKRS